MSTIKQKNAKKLSQELWLFVLILAGAVLLLAASAHAGGPAFLGNTRASDGGTAHNQYTGTGTNTFKIPNGAQLLVQCDSDVRITTGDRYECRPNTCLGLLKDQILPVGCTGAQVNYTLFDAGVYSGCIAGHAQYDGGSAVTTCSWFQDNK